MPHSEPGPRTHLCLLTPWRQALACYGPDDDADIRDLHWGMPDKYSADDTLVVVVSARELAILNVEVLTTGSEDDFIGTETYDFPFTDGISVRALELRMREPFPAPPVTLGDGYAQRLLEAIDRERHEPTPWQVTDTTGCAQAPQQSDSAYGHPGECLCCGEMAGDTSGGSGPDGFELHWYDPGRDGVDAWTSTRAEPLGRAAQAAWVCESCHSTLQQPFGPSVEDLMYSRRPRCPACRARRTDLCLWGMPPGPPPPGVAAMGCVIPVGTGMPEYSCAQCGFLWSEDGGPVAGDGGLLSARRRPRPRERVRARTLPREPAGDDELVIGEYRAELVDSAWGPYVRHSVITADGARSDVQGHTVRREPQTPGPLEPGRPSTPLSSGPVVWMETTDHEWDTLGETIDGPYFEEEGKVCASAALAQRMRPGDVVLHWWCGDDAPSGIWGWSVVVDHPALYYTATNDDAESITPRPEPGDSEAESLDISRSRLFVPLSWQRELPEPVTLADVRRASKTVLAVQESESSDDSQGPLAVPFMKNKKREIRKPRPYAIAWFPTPLLGVLPRLPELATLTSGASKVLRKRSVVRDLIPQYRAAIQGHALEAASRFLEADGYRVTDVSGFAGHQLEAVKGSERWAVHVVGTGDAEPATVELRISDRTPSTALIVVDDIEIVPDFEALARGDVETLSEWEDGSTRLRVPLAGSNGRLRAWWPWQPGPVDGTATTYDVGLGACDIEMAVQQPDPYSSRPSNGRIPVDGSNV